MPTYSCGSEFKRSKGVCGGKNLPSTPFFQPTSASWWRYPTLKIPLYSSRNISKYINFLSPFYYRCKHMENSVLHFAFFFN